MENSDLVNWMENLVTWLYTPDRVVISEYQYLWYSGSETRNKTVAYHTEWGTSLRVANAFLGSWDLYAQTNKFTFEKKKITWFHLFWDTIYSSLNVVERKLCKLILILIWIFYRPNKDFCHKNTNRNDRERTNIL